MRYSGTYAVVLVLHLLTVAFVIGPTVDVGSLAARISGAGGVAALAWTVVIALMVLKPGA